MILCLDYGDRYIGMAATDQDGRIPYRYGTIDQKNQSVMPEISAIIAREQIKKILVGVPMGLEGNETEQTHKSLAFIDSLRAALGEEMDIESVDETLTSVEAQRMIRYEGGKPEDEHAEAARLMLQDYLRGGLHSQE